MKLFRITDFSGDAPHWDVAFIEAGTRDEARIILADRLADGLPGEVWGVAPVAGWTVAEVERPFVFILGGGCR